MNKQCPFGVECSGCRFCRTWILNDGMGHQKVEERCGFEVLMDNLPKMIGSLDGLQGGINEARNRSIEAKGIVDGFVARLEEIAIHRRIGQA